MFPKMPAYLLLLELIIQNQRVKMKTTSIIQMVTRNMVMEVNTSFMLIQDRLLMDSAVNICMCVIDHM